MTWAAFLTIFAAVELAAYALSTSAEMKNQNLGRHHAKEARLPGSVHARRPDHHPVDWRRRHLGTSLNAPALGTRPGPGIDACDPATRQIVRQYLARDVMPATVAASALVEASRSRSNRDVPRVDAGAGRGVDHPTRRRPQPGPRPAPPSQ